MITFNDYYYGHNAHESWMRRATEMADGCTTIRPAINPSLRADAINWFGPPTIRVQGRIPRIGEPRRLNELLWDDIDIMDFF